MTVNLNLKTPIFCSNSSLSKILLHLKLSGFRICTHYNYCFLLLHYHVKNWIFEADNMNIEHHCVLVKNVYTHTHTPIHTNIATVSPCPGSYTETSRSLPPGIRSVLSSIKLNSFSVFKHKVSLCILSELTKLCIRWKC